MGMRAINAILAEAWAIQPAALQSMLEIAGRESEYSGNLEALEKKLGRPLGNAMATTVRDGIATIPVQGPMFRYANLFTMFSGATSYDVLATDLEAAVSDPSVRGIILQIDSPGGEVNGASEFAQHVAAVRGRKPIVAYVGGMGASSAFWIASAADKIVAADTAMLGSIGAVFGTTVKDPKAGETSYKFVSSQSPYKQAGPETDAGAAQLQRIVDDIAQVFIDAVATNRGTESAAVLENYGQGAVFIASEALARGMIDQIGTYESVFSTMTKEVNSMDYKTLTAEALAEHRPDLVAAIGDKAVAAIDKPDVAAIRAEAAQAERTRIAGIEALAMPGAEELVAKFKADGTSVESAAVEILKAAKAKAADPAAKTLAALANAEANNTQPAPARGEDNPNRPGVLADSVLQLAGDAGVIRK